MKRIFLFSDGLVNSGVTDRAEIYRQVSTWADRRGLTVSTFGIGADFDEPLMRGIAEAGKGRYTFLATAPDITRLVSKSIHDLLKLYGSEAVLDIRGGAHTVVEKVYGGDDDEELPNPATAGVLQLGDLHDGNERMVLLELASSPAGDCEDGQSFAAAEWMLSCQRNGSLLQFSGSVTLKTSRERQGEEDPAVKAMFTLRRASDMESEVAAQLQDRNLSGARDVKTRQLLMLSQALDALRSSSVEPVFLAALERVHERAQRVAEKLDNDAEDIELARRQCVQEVDLTRALSIAGWSDGLDSSEGSPCGDWEGHSGHSSPRLRTRVASGSGSDISGASLVSNEPPVAAPQATQAPEPQESAAAQAEGRQRSETQTDRSCEVM